MILFLTFDGVPEGKVSKEKKIKKISHYFRVMYQQFILGGCVSDIVRPAAQRSRSLLVCTTAIMFAVVTGVAVTNACDI